jgi:hypothetical protein
MYIWTSRVEPPDVDAAVTFTVRFAGQSVDGGRPPAPGARQAEVFGEFFRRHGVAGADSVHQAH